jgi:L-ascorbate metabolism protein UlaG (beta-lactamase superfamily)
MVTLRYFGHSAFEIRGGGSVLLVDPFLTGNSHTTTKPEDLKKVDYIFITHGHGDHIGDSVAIAKRTGATVVANFEICQYLGQKGISCHPMHIGGSHVFPFGKVKLTVAHHGSDIAEGEKLIPGGNPCGFLFDFNGTKVYHAGDTGLTMDMQLLARDGVTAALLPIGGNFVMDMEDAARAVEFIRPKMVVPMHYDTFPLIMADPKKFSALVGDKATVRVMQPGETLQLD